MKIDIDEREALAILAGLQGLPVPLAKQLTADELAQLCKRIRDAADLVYGTKG